MKRYTWEVTLDNGQKALIESFSHEIGEATDRAEYTARKMGTTNPLTLIEEKELDE